MKFFAFALPLTLACACTCCNDSETYASSYSFIETDGGLTIEEAGVEIVVVDVSYRSSSTTVNGRTEGSRTMLGHPFGIRDGRFFIGPEDYGPAPEGARVRVATSGVTIDGERRGDVPAPLPESEEE